MISGICSQPPSFEPFHYEYRSSSKHQLDSIHIQDMRVLDYIPILSMISGVFHMTVGLLSLYLLPLTIVIDLFTLGTHSLSERVSKFASERCIRSILCFIPVAGNLIIYMIDRQKINLRESYN